MTSSPDTAEEQPQQKKESWGEVIRTVIYAVLIAMFVRTVAYEPFSIPSESMLPTLLVGDYLFVSKYAYGYSRHSLPFSPPVGDGRVWESQVDRGDVAVFKLPRDNSTDYIKRIIGLPGDRLRVTDGIVYLNDEPIKRERIEDFIYRLPDGGTRGIARFRETLPNGRSYETLDINPRGSADNTGDYVVPEGHYFAMGDNRDNSVDSRVPRKHNGVGFIPAENLVGRAEVLFFSKPADVSFLAFWNYRFGRFFNSID